MLKYDNLTLTDIQALPRDRTIFALAMSPIEVHGPHLPVGIDVVIAENVLELVAERASSAYPNLGFVSLPSLYLGADALPVPGSLGVSARALESILYDLGKGLAVQGFKYLLVTDNHGGPSHQLAVPVAV